MENWLRRLKTHAKNCKMNKNYCRQTYSLRARKQYPAAGLGLEFPCCLEYTVTQASSTEMIHCMSEAPCVIFLFASTSPKALGI